MLKEELTPRNPQQYQRRSPSSGNPPIPCCGHPSETKVPSGFAILKR